jgi:hypothetical protein
MVQICRNVILWKNNLSSDCQCSDTNMIEYVTILF